MSVNAESIIRETMISQMVGEIIAETYVGVMNQGNYEKLIRDCISCGIVNKITHENGKRELGIRFIYSFCEKTEVHQTIYRKLSLDALMSRGNIFSRQIIAGNPWILGYDNHYPVIVLFYKNDEDMIKDMISARNYIRKSLGNEKNRDN